MAVLLDDDTMYPTNLEAKLAVLEDQPNVGIVHSAFDYIDSDGEVLAERIDWTGNPQLAGRETGREFIERTMAVDTADLRIVRPPQAIRRRAARARRARRPRNRSRPVPEDRDVLGLRLHRRCAHRREAPQRERQWIVRPVRPGRRRADDHECGHDEHREGGQAALHRHLRTVAPGAPGPQASRSGPCAHRAQGHGRRRHARRAASGPVPPATCTAPRESSPVCGGPHGPPCSSPRASSGGACSTSPSTGG